MSDVFPPRDLPDAAESWGREVESTEDLLNAGQGRRSSQTKALNRSLASTSQSLSERLQRLNEGSSSSENTQYLFGDAFPGFFEPWFITGPSWARFVVIAATTLDAPGLDPEVEGYMFFTLHNKAGSPPDSTETGESISGELIPPKRLTQRGGTITLTLDLSRRVYTNIHGSQTTREGAEITTQVFYQWF